MPRCQRISATLLIATSLLLSACTPDKARALKAAAMQFKEEALAALTALENLAEAETRPVPRSNMEVAEEFATNILDIPEDEDLSVDVIELALEPYTVSMPGVEAERKRVLGSLRKQYAEFASIFDELPGGSFLARDSVARSHEFAKKLTLQMAAFSESISQHPPQLLQYRAALLARIDTVRKNDSLSKDEKMRRLMDMVEEWQSITVHEQELQQAAVERCLKAATLGMHVSRLIESYDKLSLDDINSTINKAFDATGALSGKDFSSLKKKSAEVFAAIEQDPVWSDVAGMALDEANRALGARQAAADPERER